MTVTSRYTAKRQAVVGMVRRPDSRGPVWTRPSHPARTRPRSPWARSVKYVSPEPQPPLTAFSSQVARSAGWLVMAGPGVTMTSSLEYACVTISCSSHLSFSSSFSTLSSRLGCRSPPLMVGIAPRLTCFRLLDKGMHTWCPQAVFLLTAFALWQIIPSDFLLFWYVLRGTKPSFSHYLYVLQKTSLLFFGSWAANATLTQLIHSLTFLNGHSVKPITCARYWAAWGVPSENAEGVGKGLREDLRGEVNVRWNGQRVQGGRVARAFSQCVHHSREGDRGRAIVSSWMYVIWWLGGGRGGRARERVGVSLNQLITSGRR